jgi:hypothetical protein
VHDPFLFPNRGGDGASERGFVEGVEELGSEDPGESFHREKETMVSREPGKSIGCQCASRDEIVNMGMIGEVAAPGVQDAEHADLSTQEARVKCQELGGCGGGTEEQFIEEGLVAASDWAQSGREGEGEHEVRDRQEQVLLGLEPLLGSVVLAFRAVAVAAGMVAVAQLVALGTGVELSAESVGAAVFDGVHGPAVRGEQVMGVLLAVGRAVLAKDVCQL